MFFCIIQLTMASSTARNPGKQCSAQSRKRQADMFGCSDERYEVPSFLRDSPAVFQALAGKTLRQMEILTHIQEARVHGKTFTGANGILMVVRRDSSSGIYGLFLSEDNSKPLVQGELVGVVTGDLQLTCTAAPGVRDFLGGRHMRPSCYAWCATAVELERGILGDGESRRGRKRTLQLQVAADRRCTVLSMANTSAEAYAGRSSQGCNLMAVSCRDLPQVLLVFATATVHPGQELRMAYTPDHDEEGSKLEEDAFVVFVAPDDTEVYARLLKPTEVYTADNEQIQQLGVDELAAVCIAAGARLADVDGTVASALASGAGNSSHRSFTLGEFLHNPSGVLFPVGEASGDLWYSPGQRALFTRAGTMLALHALVGVDPDETYVQGLAVWEEGKVARDATLGDAMAL